MRSILAVGQDATLLLSFIVRHIARIHYRRLAVSFSVFFKNFVKTFFAAFFAGVFFVDVLWALFFDAASLVAFLAIFLVAFLAALRGAFLPAFLAEIDACLCLRSLATRYRS